MDHLELNTNLPELDGVISVSGLEGTVEVFRDSYGIPHVRAESIADAYFGQGFVTAQDRLWQMELHRRIALANPTLMEGITAQQAGGRAHRCSGGRSARCDAPAHPAPPVTQRAHFPQGYSPWSRCSLCCLLIHMRGPLDS